MASHFCFTLQLKAVASRFCFTPGFTRRFHTSVATRATCCYFQSSLASEIASVPHWHLWIIDSCDHHHHCLMQCLLLWLEPGGISKSLIYWHSVRLLGPMPSLLAALWLSSVGPRVRTTCPLVLGFGSWVVGPTTLTTSLGPCTCLLGASPSLVASSRTLSEELIDVPPASWLAPSSSSILGQHHASRIRNSLPGKNNPHQSTSV